MIIKFRGKRLDNNEWVYGSPYIIKEEEKAFILNNCQSLRLTSEDSTFTGFSIDPITLSQFTGLKDKNGKEIYEGDRIKCNKIMAVVEFGECAEGFIGFYVKLPSHLENPIGSDNMNGINTSIEIIGNIHDKTNEK